MWAFASRAHPHHGEVYFEGKAQNNLPVFLEAEEKFASHQGRPLLLAGRPFSTTRPSRLGELRASLATRGLRSRSRQLRLVWLQGDHLITAPRANDQLVNCYEAIVIRLGIGAMTATSGSHVVKGVAGKAAIWCAFDLLGGDRSARLWLVLKPGGRVVSIADLGRGLAARDATPLSSAMSIRI